MLEINNICKSYKSKLALKNISIKFTPGIYGLLGPNGAGKSTLMNIITDNLSHDSGEVLWNGRKISDISREYRSILGYAPQQQGLYDSFTGRRFLTYMGALKNIDKKEVDNEVIRVAEFVNLKDVLDRRMCEYSGGMKQRILIAQSIMGNPQLIVMDEPTAGLDPRERVRVRNRIHELASDKIIIVATHVVSDVESVAKEIIILKEGELIANDTPANLINQYLDESEMVDKTLEDVYMKVFGDV